MKTFGQLTFKERIAAVEFATELLIEHVVSGVIEIDTKNPINQHILETILSDARKQENPKIAKDMILNSIPLRREVDKIAIAAAEGSMYNDSGEAIMQTKRSLQ